MNLSVALREIIMRQNQTQSSIARKLGVSQPAIASVLSVGNPQARVLISMLSALNYKLVAMPQDAPLPEGAYELEAQHTKD